MMMRAFSTPLLAALLAAAAVAPAMAAPAPVKHAAPAAAAPSATSAPATPVEGDLRCLLTMAVLGQDKTKQQAAVIGAYFFMGRLSARAPGLDVAAAVKALEAKLAPKDLPAEAQRCGPLVQGAMGSLQKSFGPPPGAAAPAPAPAPAPAAPAPAAPAPK
jgi:hypothetical protein